MTSIVNKFSLKALHVFQIRTLKSFGFHTRVALSNKSQNKKHLGTDYRIDVTVYSPDGNSSQYYHGVANLPINAILRLDCSQWEQHNSRNEDHVVIFHLIPIRLLSNISENDEVDIDRSEIWGLFTAQDHYVEYYKSDGFSGGVLYQSGAFNYSKFSREETTVIQAPKVFLSATLDTILSILYTSFEQNRKQDAILECALLDLTGNVVAQWVEVIKLFTVKSISIKKIIQMNSDFAINIDEFHSYTLLAICKNAALLPLIFNIDQVNQTMAVEHSLPPMYYGSTVTGEIRAQMIANLNKSYIFKNKKINYAY